MGPSPDPLKKRHPALSKNLLASLLDGGACFTRHLLDGRRREYEVEIMCVKYVDMAGISLMLCMEVRGVLVPLFFLCINFANAKQMAVTKPTPTHKGRKKLYYIQAVCSFAPLLPFD